MDLKNKIFIKTSNKLKIKKENGNIIVENTSTKREKIIFIKPIITNRKDFKLINNIETLAGEDCNIKILNKKLKVSYSINQNIIAYMQEINKLFFLGISFEPVSKYVIKKLEYNINETDEKQINEYFKNKVLIITPGYPSNQDKYNCAFIHTRAKEYKQNNLHVDIAVVNDLYINNTEFYSFEGIDVCRTGYNQIRMLLLNKKYDKILIHFPVPTYYRILDAVNLNDTQVLLYSHGVDTLFYDYDKIGAPYFTNSFEIPDSYKATFRDRTEGLIRYNQRDNFKFVFVTDWNRKYSEKMFNIKYKDYDIVPCFIDNKTFSYKKKDKELRKKIFMIRPQNNLKSYSIDINVRIILELSHRSFFDDLEFNIYGDGELHDKLLAPLRKFSNVHIHKKFLTHDEIAAMHKKHGIGLFASRFDNQAVSACEAAMSGCVVLTSKGIGAVEYVNPELGTYFETENYKEYADMIEELYYNPDKFLEYSKKMHEYAMDTCSYDYSIKKDIDIIKNFNKKEIINIPKLSKSPLLSISIASYNVSKFIIQILCSLLRSKYAKDLEILVVNDGSKDDTVKVVNEFIKKHYHGTGQSIIRVIDKENGGHGSTINKGIEVATGKYFRLLDGDDYYVTEEFDKYIEKLKNEESDLILTNYIEDFAVTGVYNRLKLYEELSPEIQYKIDDITSPGYGFETWGPILHTSTYKTQILKDANFKIDEHCFYVDMEYNLMGIINAETVTYYPYDIYSYYLGRQGQSVSPESFKKNVLQHEKVCLRLIDEYTKKKDTLSQGKLKYIAENMIVPLCKTQYDITTEYFKNSTNFLSFDKKLKKYPEFYNDIRIAGRRIKLYRVMRGKIIFMNPFIKKILNKMHR